MDTISSSWGRFWTNRASDAQVSGTMLRGILAHGSNGIYPRMRSSRPFLSSSLRNQILNLEYTMESNSIKINKEHWENTASKNIESEYYNLEKILDGGLSLSQVEIDALGPVDGLTGCHLQCGFGLDTISISKLGARMTGLDFSVASINEATRLAAKCDANCSFHLQDILSPNWENARQYDFVYTSHGVLRWLSSLTAWANNIYKILKPKGRLFIFEIHPLVYRMKKIFPGSGICIDGNYFDQSEKQKFIKHTHAVANLGNYEGTVCHFDWKLSDIMNAVISSGLSIKEYQEYNACSYHRKGLIPKQIDNLWYLENKVTPMPLSFSLSAQRSS